MWVWALGRTLKPSQTSDWLELYQELGFTDAVFVLNDYGFDSFGTFASPQRVADVCRRYRDAGIRPHLMSWVKPSADFINAAADVLVPLCGDAGAVSLMWDVEEYWTKPSANHAQVAHEVLAPAFADLPCPMGTTGITALPGKVKPMVEVSDYGVPQAYSFPNKASSSWYYPGRTQRLANQFWSPFGKPLVMGLASYKQGPKPVPAMSECVESSLAVGVDRVCYWGSASLRDNAAVRSYVSAQGATVGDGPSFLEGGGLGLSTAALLAAGAAGLGYYLYQSGALS
jgi:hypothetical protein